MLCDCHSEQGLFWCTESINRLIFVSEAMRFLG